jgi:hypothetical protein
LVPRASSRRSDEPCPCRPALGRLPHIGFPRGQRPPHSNVAHGERRGERRQAKDILAPRRDDDQDDRSVKATPAAPLRRPRTRSSIWTSRCAVTPGPLLRVERAEPPLIERVNDLAYMRLVGVDERRDLLRTRPVADAQQINARSRLTSDVALRDRPLELVALLGQQFPDKHRRGNASPPPNSDASLFATRRPIPVNDYETDHYPTSREPAITAAASERLAPTPRVGSPCCRAAR